MKHLMTHALLLGLALLLALPAGAEEYLVTDPPALTAAPSPAPVPSFITTPAPFADYPALGRDGFLEKPLSENGPAFIHVDVDAGHWIYISTDLRVEIQRRAYKEPRRQRIFYFIADVRFKGSQLFRAYSDNPAQPEKGYDKPENIARQHNLIYAQNGDLFTWRIEEKRYPGLIIRDGKIVRDQTYDKATVNGPPLDELSLYPDGHMEMHSPGELGANDYLQKGALDVLAFGPLLIKNSQLDERVLGSRFRSLEPRSAIGFKAPGHFVGILVEGRNKRSAGAGLLFVAQRLLEEGCSEAFTLDGGQTAAMIFMGSIVMDPGTYSGFTKTRRQPDVIGIGVTQQTVGKPDK
jgi:hypothetical protein